MEIPAGRVRAFRKTFDISVGAPSTEAAKESFREMVEDVYSPIGVRVVLEDIYDFEGRPSDADPGYIHPMYPAKATIAALTDTASQAEEAFSALVGSVSNAHLELSEISFDAMEAGEPEEGSIVPPRYG